MLLRKDNAEPCLISPTSGNYQKRLISLPYWVVCFQFMFEILQDTQLQTGNKNILFLLWSSTFFFVK